VESQACQKTLKAEKEKKRKEGGLHTTNFAGCSASPTQSSPSLSSDASLRPPFARSPRCCCTSDSHSLVVCSRMLSVAAKPGPGCKAAGKELEQEYSAAVVLLKRSIALPNMLSSKAVFVDFDSSPAAPRT